MGLQAIVWLSRRDAAANPGFNLPGAEGNAVSESTREAVNDLYAAYARRDLAGVAARIDDDVDWIIYGPVHIFPFVGQRRGKCDVLRALADIAKDYQLESYRPEIVIVDGDRAAVMSDVAFLQRATARLMRFRVANFLRLRAGRVTEFREFANTFDVAEQARGRVFDV
jgi:ketosteroid isomerase-like protein